MISLRAALMMAGGLFATSLNAADLDHIIAKGELRACFSRIDPALIRTEPTDCTEDCIFEGLIVDQVRAFTATLEGVVFSPRVVSWSSQFENDLGKIDLEASYVPRLLADGTCDLFVSNLALLPWRLKMMRIEPLFESRMIAIVRSDRNGDFSQLSDLAGGSMAVTLNSSFHTWAQEMNVAFFESNPVRFPDLADRSPLDMVLDGTADFTVTDADIAVFLAKIHGDELVPAFAVGPIQKLGWGMHPEAKDLQAHIAGYFNRERDNPSSDLNTAWERHLGVSIPQFETLVSSLPGELRDKDTE